MKQKVYRILAAFLAASLLSSAAFVAAGCAKKETPESTPESTPVESREDAGSGSEEQRPEDSAEVTILGEGAVKFAFLVTDLDGNEKTFEIHTDEKTVGAALLKEELIKGEEGQYGLMVDTVDGTTLDYNKDGMYWAFYVDGEYAMTGVDQTEVTDGATYAFKPEK